MVIKTSKKRAPFINQIMKNKYHVLFTGHDSLGYHGRCISLSLQRFSKRKSKIDLGRKNTELWATQSRHSWPIVVIIQSLARAGNRMIHLVSWPPNFFKEKSRFTFHCTFISFFSFGSWGLRLSVMLSTPSSSLASMISLASASSGTRISR